MVEDSRNLPLSIKELVNNLSEDEADLVTELVKSSVLDQAIEWNSNSNSSELKLDLHGMHLSTAYLILLQWLGEMQLRFMAGKQAAPAEIVVVCGCGKHSAVRGESPPMNMDLQRDDSAKPIN